MHCRICKQLDGYFGIIDNSVTERYPAFASKIAAKLFAISKGYTEYVNEHEHEKKPLDSSPECLFDWQRVVSKNSIYTRAKKLEQTILDALVECQKLESVDKIELRSLRILIQQMLEYEHGTADVTDLHSRLSLNGLLNVYEDLALALIHSI